MGEVSGELVLTATIDEVLFQSPDSSFVVVRATAGGEAGPVVAAGAIGETHPGDVFRLSGAFDDHPRYGRQFRVDAAVPVTPSTEFGIYRFLASGRFKGVGKRTAERVVKAFGIRTFELLLAEGGPPAVEGVGRKKLSSLTHAVRQERERIETITFLAGLGLTIRLATRAIDAFGARCVRTVRDDPYALSNDVEGIGFLTADRVAASLGVSGEHPLRLRAALLHVLDVLADDGHVCVSTSHLLRRGALLTGAGEDALESALDALAAAQRVVLDSRFDGITRVYRPDLHAAEQEVVRALKDGRRRQPILGAEDELPGRLPAHLSEEQQDAVRLLLTRPVAILTGGPGVGKTTVLQAVADAARALGREVVLAAPTGRAARRITEASGIEAFTIHKLLGLRPDAGRSSAAPTLRVEADALIIDEASMLDLKLFAHVLRQTDPAAALILVGDKDQLPSVGPGDVLNDLISSGAVPVARLERIFRQESAGFIVRNAHRALAGLPPVLPGPGELADFYFMERDDPAEGADLIRDLVTSRLPSRMGFDPRNDIQVLTPMYRGLAGADNLNSVLQNALNGGAPAVSRGDLSFRVGDRIIYTRNDYDRDLANGDLGRVASVDAKTKIVEVRFGDAVHRFDSWSDLKLAFALTVHKAQGSEYPVVILPVFVEHRVMLRRAVIYTAMTRAKKLLVIVGQPAALARALSETRRDARGSLLGRRLAPAAATERRVEPEDDPGRDPDE
jgi:exodeoxyribonuclease V alpha subunit